jgi:glycerol-3-phosphate acyltransferase PlsY
MTGIVLVAAAYLLGSIPSAFLLARYLRGIDIREYGSGNVGASNVMAHLGLRTGIALGVFDTLFKGTMPVVVANLLGQSLLVQAAVAIASIAGHNWSAYLKFTGGRGISIGIGVLLGMGLWVELAAGLLLIGLMGRVVMKDTGIWSLVSFLALPFTAILVGRPPEVVYMLGGMALMLVIKRLVGNWEWPSTGRYGPARVLLHRFLWDRDVPKQEAWTGRMPDPERERADEDIAGDAVTPSKTGGRR